MVQGEKKKKGLKGEREFLLTCIESTIVALGKKVNICLSTLIPFRLLPFPSQVTESEHFCTFLWRSLLPATIRLLVRGSGHSLLTALTCLAGHLGSHRAVLEAAHHGMLVQTPPEKRLEGVRAISRLLLLLMLMFLLLLMLLRNKMF